MRIHGIDFTSRPSRRKPITCLACILENATLRAGELEEFHTFDQFESMLQRPGPWVAGIDFPFGQARRFVETIGWPNTWAGYVDHVASLDREKFRSKLDEYRAPRASGDKEHRRERISPRDRSAHKNSYGTPVGLMFFEGAPRLQQAGLMIPGLQHGDPGRIVVEAYPGVMARRLIGRRGYKNDTKRKQTPAARRPSRAVVDDHP
ncbi:MAG: DUF429 domain-containing protein [Halofilum sp. (in: g-proteobacteria)]|nr:DUF429 domain-containing protein [Halofilum sp. (in: g-proteobacteria)]